jgi:hypothetical protein
MNKMTSNEFIESWQYYYGSVKSSVRWLDIVYEQRLRNHISELWASSNRKSWMKVVGSKIVPCDDFVLTTAPDIRREPR